MSTATKKPVLFVWCKYIDGEEYHMGQSYPDIVGLYQNRTCRRQVEEIEKMIHIPNEMYDACRSVVIFNFNGIFFWNSTITCEKLVDPAISRLKSKRFIVNVLRFEDTWHAEG